MGRLRRIAPTFPVRDLDASTEHYERLGFVVRRYDGGGYAYVTLDDVELHLGLTNGVVAPMSAYIWVDDADELATRWTAAGADVRTPENTPWGQHEGALVDPDGNVIRFGSPVTHPSTGDQ